MNVYGHDEIWLFVNQKLKMETIHANLLNKSYLPSFHTNEGINARKTFQS